MNRRAFLTALSLASAGPLLTTPLVARAEPPFTSDRIAVRTVGSGPDVILVPGLMSSPRLWEAVVAATPGYRFHLVQLNGFAGLPAAGAAQGEVVAPAAEEIARYITASRLVRPALVGHSLGGEIALMIAARHPTLLSRILVVDSFPWLGVVMGPPGATPQSLAPMAQGMAAGMAQSTAAQWEASVQRQTAGMVRTESARAGVVADGLVSDHGVAGRAMSELVTTDLRPEIGRITIPVTILYAHGDQYPTTPEQTDALFRREYAGLPQARLQRIDGANHFIMLDQPQRFATELATFLRG